MRLKDKRSRRRNERFVGSNWDNAAEESVGVNHDDDVDMCTPQSRQRRVIVHRTMKKDIQKLNDPVELAESVTGAERSTDENVDPDVQGLSGIVMPQTIRYRRDVTTIHLLESKERGRERESVRRRRNKKG